MRRSELGPIFCVRGDPVNLSDPTGHHFECGSGGEAACTEQDFAPEEASAAYRIAHPSPRPLPRECDETCGANAPVPTSLPAIGDFGGGIFNISRNDYQGLRVVVEVCDPICGTTVISPSDYKQTA